MAQSFPYEELLRPLLDATSAAGPALGTVAAVEIAHGVFASVTGVLPDDRNATLTGFVISTREVEPNYEGWARHAGLVLTMATDPAALDGVAIAVPTTDTVAVLQPPVNTPAVVPAPWVRLGAHEQVVAALADAGLTLQETLDDQGRSAWIIPGIDRTFAGDHADESMATLLFGPDRWQGRTTPLLRQRFVDKAISEGRWHGSTADGPTPLQEVRGGAYGSIIGIVDGTEQTITGEFDRVWSPSHGIHRSASVNVVVTVTDPEPRPGEIGQRVITIAVPAMGADFTITSRPADPASRPPTTPRQDATRSSESSVDRFHPASQDDLAPSGDATRVRANIAALHVLRTLQAEHRTATEDEQRVLARWSGWGAVAGVFDPDRDDHATYAWAREQLTELLSEDEWRAARRTTLNAHYTDGAVVKVVWAAVQRMGFTGGDVLEPGSGSGNFIGFAPAAARMVGVELDPTTAAISAALYPDAQIIAESFADTRVRAGSFDMVVGNVPFAQVKPHDRRHNPAGHSLHDYFMVKSLHLLRPGGLMAVLTSHYSMDRANPAARREIASLADLVGAARLPSGSMAKAAGTDAVIDLLILRRREDGRPAAPADQWETTQRVTIGDTEVRLNSYYLTHPERVLGRLGTGGLHNAEELVVVGDRDCAAALTTVLADIITEAKARGLTYSDVPAEAQQQPIALVAAAEQQPEGYLTALTDGGFSRVIDGQTQPYAPPKTQAQELRELLRLRDTAMRLLEAEAASRDDTDEIDRLRAELGQHYDSYLARNGPINRYNTYATGTVDEDTGETVLRRVAPAQGGFRTDPFASLVYALERFDEAAQIAYKSDIFTTRAIAPRDPKLGADTPEDAIAICRDVYGELTLDRVAWLLGLDGAEARQRLGTLVFDEPGSDRLVPAAEYLSGNVRAKLNQARAAAEEDEQYAPNVEALTAVKPVDLTPEEIRVRLGASWVSGDVVQQFLQDLLDDPTLKVEHLDGGTDWDVTSKRKATTLATNTWGTERMSAVDIAKALLQQRPVRVYDVDPVTEKRTLNPDATLAAQTKATEIDERFAEWLWSDPQRATAHLTIYNERFNSLVLRSYDDVRLTLPGLSLTFKPLVHQHQYAAVARMIQEPSVGLFHDVGAGKTAEMVMGVMELRRLGLARKPMIIVPNHMLEQFGREFLQLYPQANLLSASSADLTADRRRLFQARVTTGNWDAVIMTHRAFEQVAMSPQYQRTYLKAKIEKLEARLETAKANNQKRLVKQLEASISRAEERIKKKLDTKKDPGLTFEMMGVDYLCVDEGHLFKNLERNSKIPGMGIPGSNRSTDLDMKGRFLRASNGRAITIATATPIANSLGEVHTMLSYLAPDLMAQLGIDEFDAWAGTFGETVEGIEVVPEGGGLRVNSRFAKFYNVPELLRIMHQVADVKTAEDLKLPVPQLRQRDDGQRAPQIVVVPPSAPFDDYLAALVDRADKVRRGDVDPTEDNLLKITHNGRSAAMDLRLVPPTVTEIADVLHRYEVLDNDEAIAAVAAAVSAIWTRRRPNPLEPDTVAWPTEVREPEGELLWPGVFDEAAENALLNLVDRHEWHDGPLTVDQILDTLTNYDGLADAAVREQVAAHLIDTWSAEPPDPRIWGTFQWPELVLDEADNPVWTGTLPSSLRQQLANAYRTAGDATPLTVDQLADLMDRYDSLGDAEVRERLAGELHQTWSAQPPTAGPFGQLDTSWLDPIYAPPAVVWSGPFTEEVQAALLGVRSLDPSAPSKLTVAADTIARIYAEHRDDVFAHGDGQPHPRAGGLQIVFSDLGVPADGWNAYDELRNQLVARGVPRGQIRFMHEANNDAEKAQLFAAAREGRVSVLLGSTEKMGVGTNVQARAVALHHLDCPWRPADLQQREGRILRQGNQNAEVEVVRYVTEGSFDGFMWQTVARKAQFIAQLMRGRLDVREIEDVGDAALSYNEVKALATGNPLLLDQASLLAEVTKLERLERSHHKERDRMHWVRRQHEQDITILRAEIAEALAAQERRIDTTGDKFRITVLGQETTERKQGNILLRDALTALTKPPPRGVKEVALIGGFTVTGEHRWIEAQNRRLVYVNMPDLPRAEFALSASELERDNADLVGRLERRLRGLEAIVGQLRRDLASKEQDLERVAGNLDAPFKHGEALNAARARLEEVNAKITEASQPETPPSSAATPNQENALAKRHIDPAIIRPGRPGHPDGNDTMHVLILTITAIAIFGWASRRDADASEGKLVPTAAIVDTALNDDGYDATALRDELEATVTDDTRTYAAEVRTYAIGLNDHDHSEYAFQLRLAATPDSVSPRQFTTLVSAVNSYQRHLQDRAIREATAASTWQGRTGDTITVDLKVLATRSYTQQRRGGTAVTTVYFTDAAGNLFTWRAPNLNAHRDGTFVRATGRIRGHEVDDGHKHTELTRCALTPVDRPPHWPSEPPSADEQSAAPTVPRNPDAGATGKSAPQASTPSPKPTVAETAPVNLDAWATRVGSRASADDIAWLVGFLTALTNEPDVLMWARTNPADRFALPFATRLSDALVNAFEQRPDLLRWAFFGDRSEQAALESEATQAVYKAITSAAQGIEPVPSLADDPPRVEPPQNPDSLAPDSGEPDNLASESRALMSGAEPATRPTDDTIHDREPPSGMYDDAEQREAIIRQREIKLKIEEHASGYHRSTGSAPRYIAEMVNAAPAEADWITAYIGQHPAVLEVPYRTADQWDEIRRARGEQALSNADAAHARGDNQAALDCLDEARAHGSISVTEWQRLRRLYYPDARLSAKAETSADQPALPDGGAPPNKPERSDVDQQADRPAVVRQRQLVLAIEQHGPGYHRATGDGVRYAAEIMRATPEEWDWMTAHVQANPHLLEGWFLGDGQIHEINREAALGAFAAATDAMKRGDFTTALDKLDDAEVHWPAGHPDRGEGWDRFRGVVIRKQTAASGMRVTSAPTSNAAADCTSSARLARTSHPTPAGDADHTLDVAGANPSTVAGGAIHNGRIR